MKTLSKKIALLSLLAAPFLANASDLNMHTLNCKGTHLYDSTTLKDVQSKYVLKEQMMDSDGRYRVRFTNDATSDTVTCYFGTAAEDSKLNSCKG